MLEIDYLVIGSGIAGLYFTYKNLLDKYYLVIDKNNYIGGRALTIDFHNIPVQMGAGIIREHDSHLLSLIKTLGLEIGSFTSNYHFPYLEYYKSNQPNGNDLIPLFNKMIKKIKDTYIQNQTHVKHLSFKNFLELYFDSKFVDLFIKNSFYLDYLEASTEVVINEYPLNEILLTNNEKFYYIKGGGWRILINKFLEKIKNIQLNTEIIKVIYYGKYYECITKSGDIIKCKKIIFATDLSIKNIQFLNIDLSILNNVDSINFLRTYTFHKNNNLKYNYKVSSVLDKIIPINNNILMSCYCDNWKAKQVKELLENNNPKKIENIDRLLKNSLADDYNLITKPIDIISTYWQHGIHYYKPGSTKKDIYTKMTELNFKGLYIIGEMFSHNQGWVEGTISSVDNCKFLY